MSLVWDFARRRLVVSVLERKLWFGSVTDPFLSAGVTSFSGQKTGSGERTSGRCLDLFYTREAAVYYISYVCTDISQWHISQTESPDSEAFLKYYKTNTGWKISLCQPRCTKWY